MGNITFIKRWLNTRGYGVQSPLAYAFLQDVIRQKHPYYAYERLLKEREKGLFATNSIHEDQLLFRIANFAQPQSIIVPQKWATSIKYLSAGCSKAQIKTYATDNLSEVAGHVAPLEMVCLNNVNDLCSLKEIFLRNAGENTVCVIKNIHKEPFLWRELLQKKTITLSFDLGTWGILFYNPKITYGRYYVTSFK